MPEPTLEEQIKKLQERCKKEEGIGFDEIEVLLAKLQQAVEALRASEHFIRLGMVPPSSKDSRAYEWHKEVTLTQIKKAIEPMNTEPTDA